MITRFWLGARRAGLTRAEFSAHWFHVHARFGRALPGLRAYVQNHAYPSAPPGVFDGCSELDFDDVDSMRAAFGSEQLRAADRDERRFGDPERYGVVITERRPVLVDEGADTDARLLCFLRADPRREPGYLTERLEEVTSAYAHGVCAVRAEVHATIQDAEPSPVCDAVVSLWFPSERALLEGGPGWHAASAAALTGVAFGRETLFVRPRRLR